MPWRLAFAHGLPAPQRADPLRAAARALDAAGRRHAGVPVVRRAGGAGRWTRRPRRPARLPLLRAGRCGARLPHAGRADPARARGSTREVLKPLGGSDRVAAARAVVGLPARAGLRPAAGVEADSGDDHVGVAAVGVHGRPLAGARGAPAHEVTGRLGHVEQPGAVQRVGDRAGAVVPAVLPLAVPAAVDVRLRGDLVAGGDDLLDRVGRARRSDGQGVGADLRAIAGGELQRGVARRARAGAGEVAQRGDVVGVDDAVDRKVVGALEAQDGAARAGAELAVDADALDAGAAQEVLEDLDVVARHALSHGDAVAEAVMGALALDVVVAADADGGGAALGGLAQGRQRDLADGAAGLEVGGALEALDGLGRARAEVAFGADLDADLDEQALERLDVRAGGAGAQRAAAELGGGPGRVSRGDGGQGDGCGAEREQREGQYGNTTTT